MTERREDVGSDWLNAFPELAAVKDPVWQEIARTAQSAHVPKGSMVFKVGDPAANYLFCIAGRVRVQQVSDSGRAITLYHVARGETCVVTTTCLLSHSEYPAEAITESDVYAMALPAEKFNEALRASEGFRDFVFAEYSKRLQDLILLVREMAFDRLDVRIAKFLLDNVNGEGEVDVTHEKLAIHLGSVRVVVSRQLNEFARRGWLELHRKRMLVLDPQALSDYVAQHST